MAITAALSILVLVMDVMAIGKGAPGVVEEARRPTARGGGTATAAVSGMRSRSKGTPLRRRTGPARRAFGAAVVGGGVDRRWSRAMIGGRSGV